jgi:hypothetical protein
MAPKREVVAPGVTDFVCGLRRVGSNAYSLVTGRVVDGVAELRVDPIIQPLDHAADLLRTEFQKLMEMIP